MSNVHHLKCAPEYFAAVLAGTKPFEIRFDDRQFAVGDTLVLMEYCRKNGATGREHRRVITFVLKGFEGLAPGYVGLGLGIPPAVDPLADLRWICPMCETCNGQEHALCTGCRQGRRPTS